MAPSRSCLAAGPQAIHKVSTSTRHTLPSCFSSSHPIPLPLDQSLEMIAAAIIFTYSILAGYKVYDCHAGKFAVLRLHLAVSARSVTIPSSHLALSRPRFSLGACPHRVERVSLFDRVLSPYRRHQALHCRGPCCPVSCRYSSSAILFLVSLVLMHHHLRSSAPRRASPAERSSTTSALRSLQSYGRSTSGP